MCSSVIPSDHQRMKRCTSAGRTLSEVMDEGLVVDFDLSSGHLPVMQGGHCPGNQAKVRESEKGLK